MLLLSIAPFFSLPVLGILIINIETCLSASSNRDAHKAQITENTGSKDSEEICETPECKEAAASILDAVDPNVNPCDDFYRFSCGKFIDETVIPDDKSNVNEFDKTDDQIQQQVKDSLEGDLNDNDPRTFKMLQSYYNTCMNTTQIEANSENDFRGILKDLGGWPVLEGESWDGSTFDWKKTVVQLRHTGYSIDYFIDFAVGADLKNNSRRVIMLDQTSLGLGKGYLSRGLEDKVVQAYLKYMIDLAEIFGANRDAAKKELTESLNFEMQLANISLAPEDRRDMNKLYNPMSIAELQASYKTIPWMDYINDLLAGHAKVEPSEEVIVAAPSFLQSFSEMIDEIPKRVLANYAMWRVAAESASQLGERARRAKAEYAASLTGTSAKPPRDRECIAKVSYNSLLIATGALYVRRFFDKTAKANAVEVMENMHKSYERIINQVDWMDEETRRAALEKLDWMQAYIGYPDEFLDDKKLDEYYKDFTVYPESFLRTQLSLSLFKRNYDFEQLRKPINKTDWLEHGIAAMANMFYDVSGNSILVPAGILQGKFFSKDRPRYMNFGAIGFFMGHEMTHGFDDEGSQFDKEGKLAEWWNPETKKKFLQRAQCIIDQYGNYTVKEVGLNLNGINTQGENIADNGGLKQAYFAYNEWEKQNGREPRLPGLNYTSQQMFWMSNARVWCTKYRPETLKTAVETDVHSPAEFRVIGTMSNMPEFSKDFNCPSGSMMNPDKKCAVW